MGVNLNSSKRPDDHKNRQNGFALLLNNRVMVAILLAVITITLRIPFMSSEIFHTDSLGYVCGAFYTWTAHPPGFIGFNLLGRFLNYLIDDINRSFVLLSIAGSALSVSMLYLLGTEIFDKKIGLGAALLMMTSINTSYFSEVALSYALEGGIATFIAYTAWKAIKTKDLRWIIICTVALSLGGSVRQTTLVFLFPLWLYAVWPRRIGIRSFLSQTTLLCVISLLWLYPNSHFVSKYWEKGERGFLSSFYNLQVVMDQWYDSSLILQKPTYTEKSAKFHWPFVELLVASKNLIQPPNDDARIEIRRASASHALKVIFYQFCKLLFYLLLSCGIAAIAFVFAPVVYRHATNTDVDQIAFFGLWIGPATLFFVLGHLGSWGYLLLYLGALLLLASALLALYLRARAATGTAANRTWMTLILLICAVNLTWFHTLKPLPHASDLNKLINVALLQYTADGIKHKYAVARSSVFKEDHRQLPYNCVTDKCLTESLPSQFGFDPKTKLWRPVN